MRIGDLVALKGRSEPLGFITKLHGAEMAYVMWFPTSKTPQRKTYCDPAMLVVVQSSEVKRGRPRKKK